MKNKISILALHLGYGGIEKTICSQANMFCEFIDTEIICLYKTVDKIPYYLNPKVKVIYLSDIKPNKKEFLNSLKEKRIFNTFKEGIKSVSILKMKHDLIKNYIINSDSKIIISTRVEFNELLNKYHNKDCITICEEHSYHHNDKKYINRIKKSLTNIDYFFLCSEYLKNDYEKFLKGMSVKVKYIPLTIDKIYESNLLNNKNIISVGRLSKEKGYSDLIDVMKLVHEKDSSIKLTICGDGFEYDNLIQLLNEYGLNEVVFLKGNLDYDSLQNEYANSSLFVMTSYEESFGLVLIEAMSHGIPCFAFDSALGACEIINDINGKLISNRNKNEMVKLIMDYFNNDKKYNFDSINKYLVKNVSEEWKKFVKSLFI